jgi:hypothetical protein
VEEEEGGRKDFISSFSLVPRSVKACNKIMDLLGIA